MKTGNHDSRAWLYPLIGGLSGGLYVLLDEGIMDNLHPHFWLLIAFHEFLDVILPIFLGISVGIVIQLFMRQKHLITQLSVSNQSLRNDLLFHTLVSQMLHEIRNPIHAISAAIENPDTLTWDEQRELIKRNLARINDLKTLYQDKTSLFDTINAREPVRADLWVPSFVQDKIQTQIKELSIHFESQIDPVEMHMHPVILEQIFASLFSNAVEAVQTAEANHRFIRLKIEQDPERQAIHILLTNNGAMFPEDVLREQGNLPVKSSTGHGLGILFVRKLLEQVGGKMKIANTGGLAEVTLWIPGKSV